jgi:hypothetical protein
MKQHCCNKQVCRKTFHAYFILMFATDSGNILIVSSRINYGQLRPYCEMILLKTRIPGTLPSRNCKLRNVVVVFTLLARKCTYLLLSVLI